MYNMIPIHKQSYTFTEIVQEESQKSKTTPTQLQPMSEDVQITELPVDYSSETITPSIVTITQPEEESEIKEKKSDEEIIIVAENELGEVVIKKTTKKSVPANTPTENEEIYKAETTEALVPLETDLKREILLETCSVLSEIVPTRQVSEILGHSAETQSIGVNIIPLTAIEEEQVLVEEKEQQIKETVPTENKAKTSLNTNEAYEVKENISQELPLSFESTFKPTLSTATTNLTPSESIVITEVHENQIPSLVPSEKLAEDVASVKYMLQEATNVTETQVITTESELKETVIPKSGIASEVYKTNKGISIEQNQDLSTTETLDIEKIVTAASKMNIDVLEPLVIQEIYTDSKPGKHLPEAFVPTEIANTRFIPQNQIITSETVAPETEGKFITGRLPPAQTAAVDVIVSEGLLTEQTQTDDKETILQISLPESTTASSEMTLLEGITVSTTDSQMPSKEIMIETTEKQQAEIKIIPKQSLTSTTVTSSESGKEYLPDEIPQLKTAQTQITCLEIGAISDVIIQESEKSLDYDAKPSMGIAGKSIKPSMSLIVSEISTADVPEKFKQYPNYQTQEATVEFETKDAMQITEVSTEESEEKYEKTTVQTFAPISAITETQQELSVMEVKSMESETELPTFELPNSYKGEQKPTHVFPASVTEIITPHISASNLTIETPESKIINITQTTLAETVISQTVASDSLAAYKDLQEISEKQADISVSLNEGITISEVLIDEKEKDYLPKDLPKQYQANIGIDFQKAAHTIEVLSNFSPEDLNIDSPLQAHAESQKVTAEAIQVLQHQTGEKENEYKADILPELKSPTYGLEHAYIELSVTETYVQEPENSYEEKEKPKEMLATKNISTQIVAIKSQTEIVTHADDIQPEELTTGKAKKYARPLQELIVTEATPADFHKELQRDIFPYEKKANINLIPGQQLIVTEITTNDREEDLKDISKPFENYATTSLSSRVIAMQEEILSHIQPKELKNSFPKTDSATPLQDVAHHITQLELMVTEKESVHEKVVQPDNKVNIEFEEGRSITVTEIQAQDRESNLAITKAPSSVHSEAKFIPCTVAVKEVVAVDDSFKKLDFEVPKATEAQIKHTLLKGVIQTEIKAEENEGHFSEILPDGKTATDNFVLEETITVSSVVSADKENKLEATQLPLFLHANLDIAEQSNIQTTEVYPSDTLALFNDTFAKEASAETTHIEQYSLTQSEMTLGETEQALQNYVVPQKKEAELSIEGASVATMEEVVTQEKENILTDHEKPVIKCADKKIEGHPVAETTETILENTVKSISIEGYDTKTANLTQSTHKSITESIVTPREKEATFEITKTAPKEVDISFREVQGIDIFEVNSADRELERINEPMAATQNAITQLDIINALQEQEVSIHEGITDLTMKQPTSTFAKSDIQPFHAAITSEDILHESELQLQDTKANTKKAEIGIREGHSVGTIISVEAATKESTLENPIIPESKHVTAEITNLKSVATKLEVFSDTHTSEISEKNVEGVTANIETIPQEAVTKLQPMIIELESEIPASKIPDFNQALIDVELWKGLEVSEVTLGETNKECKSDTPIDQKTAKVGINAELYITQTEATLTSESFKQFHLEAPEKLVAEKASNLFSSLLISENIVHESGEEIPDKLPVLISHAEVALEPAKPAHNISEILTEENENELTNLYNIDQKHASINFDSHEVAKIEEVVSQTSIDIFKENQLVPNVASIKTEELNYLIEHQPQICEKENKIDITLKASPKVAEITLQAASPLDISETHTAEKEEMLQNFELPSSFQADKHFFGKEAMIASEIHAIYDLTDIKRENDKEYVANVHQDYLEGLTNIETFLVESESTPNIKHTPESKQANSVISELSNLSVQETFIHDDHQEYIVTPSDMRRATEDYTSLRPLETTNVFISEDVLNFAIKETVPLHANVHQTTLDSITLTQNIAHEKESTFELQESIKKKIAQSTVTEQESIGTTEIFIQEKEEARSLNKQPDSKLADVTFLPQKHLSVFETISEAKEVNLEKQSTNDALADQNFLPQNAIEVVEAVSEQVLRDFSYQAPECAKPVTTALTQENIVTTDLTLGEKEIIFIEPKIPMVEYATASLNETGTVASTNEISPNIKESIIPSYKTTPENATVTILKQTPIEEIEINATYKLGKLHLDEEAPKRKAFSRQTTLETITQTEVTIQENAQHIDIEIEDCKSATSSIVTNEGVNITEVHFEEQETEKVITGKASEISPHTEIQGQNVAMVEETIAFQSSDKINLNKQRDLEVKAKQIEPCVQYGLVVSEQRSTGELESVPCIQKYDFKKGRILYESVTTPPVISEIHPEEKEGKYFILST